MKKHGGMISTEKTSDSSITALWQSYQLSPSSKVGGTGEGNDKFGLAKYFSLCLQVSLHSVKSYDMGPPALLPFEGRQAANFYRP
jgi:hypothetical protein